MRWDRLNSSDDDIYGLVRHELQELNMQTGVLFTRLHTDRKHGELYGDQLLLSSVASPLSLQTFKIFSSYSVLLVMATT